MPSSATFTFSRINIAVSLSLSHPQTVWKLLLHVTHHYLLNFKWVQPVSPYSYGYTALVTYDHPCPFLPAKSSCLLLCCSGKLLSTRRPLWWPTGQTSMVWSMFLILSSYYREQTLLHHCSASFTDCQSKLALITRWAQVLPLSSRPCPQGTWATDTLPPSQSLQSVVCCVPSCLRHASDGRKSADDPFPLQASLFRIQCPLSYNSVYIWSL